MSQLSPSRPSSLPTANEELAAQIAAALHAAGFIADSDEESAIALLNTGNAKTGDWRRILEKNLSVISTPSAIDHAAPHHAA